MLLTCNVRDFRLEIVDVGDIDVEVRLRLSAHQSSMHRVIGQTAAAVDYRQPITIIDIISATAADSTEMKEQEREIARQSLDRLQRTELDATTTTMCSTVMTMVEFMFRSEKQINTFSNPYLGHFNF